METFTFQVKGTEAKEMKCLARSLRVRSWQRRLLGYVFTQTLFFSPGHIARLIFRPFSQTSVVFKTEINYYLWAKVAKRGCTFPMLSLNITWMEKTEDLDERRGKIHTWKVSQERTRIQTVLTELSYWIEIYQFQKVVVPWLIHFST